MTGLDLTPKLLDVARKRAANAGLEIEFVEGDAEELPFEDDSFDRVTSCFGVIFAPRHELAAAELASGSRVPARRSRSPPGRRRGSTAELFKTIGQPTCLRRRPS